MSEPLPEGINYPDDWELTLEERYQLHIDLYNETGLFFHAMCAYLTARAGADHVPEDLLLAIERHFFQAVVSQSEDAARLSLGVANDKAGGPAQYKRAITGYSNAARLHFLNAVTAWGGPATDDERRKFVAKITGTTAGYLKTLRSGMSRKSKSQ